MFLKNSRGFSILEVLIAAAALGGLALVSMNLTKMNSRSTVKYSVDSDVNQFLNEVTNVLSDPAKCISSLAGSNALDSTNTITNIDSKFHTKAAQANYYYGNSKLQIDNYKLSATTNDVTVDQVSYLVISFVNKSLLQGSSGPSTFSKKVKLQVIVDASSNITSCHALGGAIWSRGAGTDIYYSSGNVGVGTTTPTALFEVKGIDASSTGVLPHTFKVQAASNSTGEGSPIMLTAGSSSSGGTGGSIKLYGGKADAGGSVTIQAGNSGGTSPGVVSINGATGGASGNQNGGNIVINGGEATSGTTHGNVLLGNVRGRVGIGTSTIVSTAILTINGGIDTNGNPVIVGKTTGNARGANAIDIQTSRNNNTQVASGSGSVAIGTNNISSGPSSVTIGDGNVAPGTSGSVAIGQGNVTSGSSNVLYGRGNTVGAFNNVSIFGVGNSSNSNGAVIFGRLNSIGTGSDDSLVLGYSNSITASSSVTIGAGIINNVANSLQIGMSNTAKITILSNGNVGMGTASPAQKLDVVGDIKTNGCLYYDSSNLGTCASDQKIKKDVHPFRLGLEALLGLHPVFYKYNGLAQFKDNGREHIGLIAQQVEKSAPSLIKKMSVKLHSNDIEESVIKGVDYGALIYVVINSIKEFYHQTFNNFESMNEKILSLQSEKDVIKADISKLRAENEEMSAELERLEKLIK